MSLRFFTDYRQEEVGDEKKTFGGAQAGARPEAVRGAKRFSHQQISLLMAVGRPYSAAQQPRRTGGCLLIA